MIQLNSHHRKTTSLIPLLQKTKDFYLLWYGYYKVLPKEHRYTLGQKIDTLLIEAMEAISAASFLTGEEKTPYIKLAIRKTDVLKIFFMLLWETKSIDNKKFIFLSEKMDGIGKMLGGWLGHVSKQNSSKKF